MAVTVRDIAAQAGVSPATVSLVINNKKGVSSATRDKVQQILNASGYRIAARAKTQRFRLRVVKYRAHGMAVEENQGFIASILDQIEQECDRLSYGVSVTNTDPARARELFAEIMRDPPDGVIVVSTELSRQEAGILAGLKCPLVVLDNSMQHQPYDSVVMDNVQIMRLAVRYLYQMGHRTIGYFKSIRQIDNLDERFEGYQSAMLELGLVPPPPTLLHTTLKGAHKEMTRLIASGEYVPRGAAVADNDSIAIGAMKAIQEAGFSVPGDVSVIGVDDIPFSAVMTPPLTTVRISRSAMGILAVRVVSVRAQHPDWPAMQLRVSGTLVERGSARRVAEGEE